MERTGLIDLGFAVAFCILLSDEGISLIADILAAPEAHGQYCLVQYLQLLHLFAQHLPGSLCCIKLSHW